MRLVRRYGVEKARRISARLAVIATTVAVSAVTMATPAQAIDYCDNTSSGYFCFYDNDDWTHRMAKEFLCYTNNLPSGARDRTSSVRDQRAGGTGTLDVFSYTSGGASEFLFLTGGGTDISLWSQYADNRADWYYNNGPCA